MQTAKMKDLHFRTKYKNHLILNICMYLMKIEFICCSQRINFNKFVNDGRIFRQISGRISIGRKIPEIPTYIASELLWFSDLYVEVELQRASNPILSTSNIV